MDMAFWSRSWGVALLAWGAFNVQAQPPLPQRNLLVEWRMNSSSEQQNQGGGLRTGEVTVDSRHGMSGRGTVVITSTTRTRTEMSNQQLQVLNGGQARIYVGSSRPVTQWQFALSGAGMGAPTSAANGNPAWQAWSSTVMLDTGRGLTVRPSWPGGSRVTVEVEARVAQQTAYAPDGQVESSEVMTTVQIPLGVWTPVGQRSGQVQQRQSGVLSTQDLSRDDNEVLELRISAP